MFPRLAESTKRVTLIFSVSKQTLKEIALLRQCGNLPERNFKLHSKKTLESLSFSGELGFVVMRIKLS